MESADTNPMPVSEGKARYKLSWHVNELFLTCNQYGGQEIPDVASILDLCKIHPSLAIEFYEIEDVGEKVTPLEAFIRSRVSITVIQLFCRLFPKALQTKNARGDFPLHVACDELLYGTYNTLLVSFLASSYPEAVRAVGSHGSLPLHKLLARYGITSLTDKNWPFEVQRLVELFPKSTVIKGPELDGQDPLHYVLSKHFHASLLECILKHVPKSVTRFTFDGKLAGGVESLAVSYAQALVSLLPQLEHFGFEPKEMSTASDDESTIEVWSIILERLACCYSLHHLELQIPSRLFSATKTYDAFVVALNKLSKLQTLVLSRSSGVFRETPISDEENIDVTQAIVELVSKAHLVNLVVREGISVSPEVILQAVAKAQTCALKTLEICSEGKHQVTEPLIALICGNGPLQSLSLKNVEFDKQPIFEALSHNTNLKSLSLPHLIDETLTVFDDEDDGRITALSTVLHYYNTTLEQIQCLSNIDDAVMKMGGEYERVQYYLSLNRLGRGRARTVNSSCVELLEVLDNVLYHNNNPTMTLTSIRQDEMASLCFGMLQEVPSKWAKCSSAAREA